MIRILSWAYITCIGNIVAEPVFERLILGNSSLLSVDFNRQTMGIEYEYIMQ